MKNMRVLSSVAVALMAACNGLAKDVAPETKTAKQATKTQTVCPIMGGEVNKSLYFDFEGKRIYVCCKGCIGTLKKDPAKYIAQLEKQGVTLDKAPAAEPAKTTEKKP